MYHGAPVYVPQRTLPATADRAIDGTVEVGSAGLAAPQGGKGQHTQTEHRGDRRFGNRDLAFFDFERRRYAERAEDFR